MAMGEAPTPPLPGLPKQDSTSPFEDPAFQNLMAMVAASQPASAAEAGGVEGGDAGAGGEGGGGGRAKEGGKTKRKAGEPWPAGQWVRGGGGRGSERWAAAS